MSLSSKIHPGVDPPVLGKDISQTVVGQGESSGQIGDDNNQNTAAENERSNVDEKSPNKEKRGHKRKSKLKHKKRKHRSHSPLSSSSSSSESDTEVNQIPERFGVVS